LDSYSKSEFTSLVHIRCSDNVGSNATPRIDAVISKMNSRKKHVYRPLPDSGATRSIIGTDVMKQLKLRYDKDRETHVKLFNASGEPMKVEGCTSFLITSDGCETVAIKYLVTSDIPGDLLVGWRYLQRMQIISPNFPKGPGSKKTTEKEKQEANFVVRRAEVEKK
jgi:hypothetical protein